MPLFFAVGESSSSLLLPTGVDVAWWLMTAAVVAVSVAALVRVLRSRELSVTARFVWVVLIVLIPPIGAIAALLLVRSTRIRSRIRET